MIEPHSSCRLECGSFVRRRCCGRERAHGDFFQSVFLVNVVGVGSSRHTGAVLSHWSMQFPTAGFNLNGQVLYGRCGGVDWWRYSHYLLFAVGVGGDRFHIGELDPAIPTVLDMPRVCNCPQSFVQVVLSACMLCQWGMGRCGASLKSRSY